MHGTGARSAQRNAVKLRSHQETEASQVAMTEPVLLAPGRGTTVQSRRGAPSASTACWAALAASSVVKALGRSLSQLRSCGLTWRLHGARTKPAVQRDTTLPERTRYG